MPANVTLIPLCCAAAVVLGGAIMADPKPNPAAPKKVRTDQGQYLILTPEESAAVPRAAGRTAVGFPMPVARADAGRFPMVIAGGDGRIYPTPIVRPPTVVTPAEPKKALPGQP